jgi:hypothetical protein
MDLRGLWEEPNLEYFTNEVSILLGLPLVYPLTKCVHIDVIFPILKVNLGKIGISIFRL